MINSLKKNIISAFGEQKIDIVETGLQPMLIVDSDIIYELCLWLRDHQDYYFDFLANLTAVDYFPENKFALVYHLTSIPYQQQVVLKVILANNRDLNELPEVSSVSSIWRTAEWHEREAFDLMGIYFVGHPDLRRILLPDDWEGYPLRKDYQEAEVYHGIAIKG